MGDAADMARFIPRTYAQKYPERSGFDILKGRKNKRYAVNLLNFVHHISVKKIKPKACHQDTKVTKKR
jgi:hypothetical protein